MEIKIKKVDRFGKRIPLEFDADKIDSTIRIPFSDFWISRSDDFPFYTLGRSAYLDGNKPEYQEGPKFMNKLLYKNFKPLYDNVIHVLQRELQEDVYLADDLCYPGFHIFPSDKKLLTVAGNWHHDYPHETLKLGNIKTSTFTIPIKIPKSGAGIEYIVSESKTEYFPYKEKEMVWHDGNILHRIASFNKYEPGEYRITMQGHLVYRNGRMEVFW